VTVDPGTGGASARRVRVDQEIQAKPKG
jgi:hypothetical protein